MFGPNDTTRAVTIPVEHDELHGELAVPPQSKGLVILALASGTGRRAARNRFVAHALQRRGLATLLVDLLTADEEHADAVDGHLRFDIPLLARRLGAAVAWVDKQPQLQGRALGYFGAGTAAAAALVRAASRAREVSAVVSRSGWTELVGAALSQVHAPTLLIVGEADAQILQLSRDALARIPAVKQLAIVPGATHFFEEPGAIDEVARLAGEWFHAHLAASAATTGPVAARA